jgi:S-DNA-T family DNA segregation ATPase FtsK/SpoIIIE
VAKQRQGKKRQGHLTPISPSVWMEFGGILLMAAAMVTVLSLLSFSRGAVTATWLRLLRQAFGWGAYILPFGLGAAGLWLFLFGFGRPIALQAKRAVGLLLLFFGGVGFMHYFSTEPQLLAASGAGGGQVGWWISRFLIGALGDAGGLLILLAGLVVGCMSLFGVSIVDVSRSAGSLARRLGEVYRERSTSEDKVAPLPSDESPAARLMEKLSRPSATPGTPGAKPNEPQGGLLVPRVVGDAAAMSPDPSAHAKPEWRLPALEDVLDRGADHELSQAEIRTRVRIIEEALANFGVPARVVEVNQGPTVTQFGVEPGFVERKDQLGKTRLVKVKVNRISALTNDLALALAASPIRIEAPVPGRALVGIEVPNVSTSLVSLRSVVDSETFQKMDSKLRVALGQDVAGQPVVADLAQMPHLLIAGATGSGKSVCINAITACLLLNNTPDDLRLIMVDPKMVELSNFNGIPHLLVPVVIEVERVVATLKWVTNEMDRRYRVFSKAGARNLDVYNQTLSARGETRLPCIVVIIDELADLMMVAPDQVERSICRIAQLARATGIHLVIATQRPSVDVVTGLIKANFPARISFAVTSQVDSRVILDTGGAEKLLGRGDMLYMASDSSKMLRLQGSYISDAELERLVAYWKSLRVASSLPADAAFVQQPLWQEMIAKEKEAAGKDELLERAIEVVREDGRASISLLQRRLRIGYSRAARLIDTMEEQGLIGPEEGTGRGRTVFGSNSQHSEAGRDSSPE